jgi:glycosyltransferase involved in cell wall biosynthesis
MRILFVDQYSVMGGGQAALLDLIPELVRRQWQLEVALPNGAGAFPSALKALGIKVHGIRNARYHQGRKTLRDAVRLSVDTPIQAFQISSILRERQFDAVYVNGPRVLLAALLAARAHGVNVVFHSHLQWSGAALRLTQALVKTFRPVVIGCSQAALKDLRLPGVRAVLIPNGVADAGYVQRDFAALPRANIGMIGRIGPEKGQADFLAAAAELSVHYPNLRFMICGEPLFGEENYALSLRAAAEGLPVEFLGWRSDVGAVLANLDLLVLPSRVEGLPRAMLEAFSAGVPVVAYPAAGIPEVIDDGRNGFLVAASNSTQLAATLSRIITEGPANLRVIAAEARLDWERRFTIQQYRSEIADLLSMLPPASHSPRGLAVETSSLR